MNHLAHLLLASEANTDLIGSLLGDFVKGPPEKQYQGDWLEGIRLHRAIDRYTDDHELHLRSRNRIAPPTRRYAGILIDVFYDHYLVRHWQRFHDLPLPEFVEEVHGRFTRHRAELPDRLQRFGDYMVTEQLLLGYGDVDVICRVITQMASRLRRPNRLAEGSTEIHRLYAELEQDFLAFFPHLVAFARARKTAEHRSRVQGSP